MIKENMKRDKYFCTSSFPQAVFLKEKQQQITSIEPTDDPDRKAFVFIQTDQLLELVRLYKFGDRDDPDLLVEVHAYEQARRDLLDRLNDR
jgi:hypothetical protein